VSWELDEKERRQVLGLRARDRYGLFLQIVVDWEEAWGLRGEDGWVVGSSPEGGDAFPLWPHASFAELCAHGEWEGARPEAISLGELLEDLLPLLEEERMSVAVFPTPEGEGTVISPHDLRQQLDAEIALGEGDLSDPGAG
jgi:hypothetical protein